MKQLNKITFARSRWSLLKINFLYKMCTRLPLPTLITNMADGDGQKVVYGVTATDKTSPKDQNAFPAYVLYQFNINRYLV